jgi:hypothetical protein
VTALDPALILDDQARARPVDRFGPAVVSWCDALPDLITELALASTGTSPGDSSSQR